MGNNCFAQTFGGGNGTAGNPYLINTPAQLHYFSSEINGTNSANYIGKYFKLTANLSGINTFIPIGNSAAKSFQGHFDGDGHTISNLGYNSAPYIGLFGYISNATIENVGIPDGNLNPASSGFAGGLVGYAVSSTISKCFSKVSFSINNTSTSGGLIGRVNNSIINNCFFTLGNVNLNVNDTNTYVGGLIGYIENNSTISNCFSSPANFTNNSISGPLYGYCSTNSNIINSYYRNNWQAQAYGTPRTEAQMRTMQFASDLNACQNLTWRGFLTNYPVLYWQGTGTALPRCLQGSGTETDPFRIRCVADLVTLSNNVAGGTDYLNQFLLVENNIDFNNDPTGTSSDFNPIGNSSTNSFRGNFNGAGHVISNLTKSGTYVGLFGYISNNATISNLGIEGFDITSSTDNGYAGALVGYANNSEINKCYSANSIVNGNRPFLSRAIYIGGLIGYLDGTSKINNSYSRASLVASEPDRWFFVDFTSYVGGLVAYISSGSTISNSYSAPLSLGSQGTRGTFYSIKNGSPSITNTYCKNNVTGNTVTQSSISLKDSLEMKSGCFVVNLNGSQPSIAWFKAKSQVNLGYPVLSWQKLSDGITPAGFEGNCLGVTTFSGNQASPYQVRYVKDLIYISNMVANDTNYSSKYFQMLNDINYNNGVIDSSSLYNPIGVYSNNKPFSGNFNGLRNAIANYSFSDTTKNNIGFFGYTRNATIQRLGISNINICAKDTVGGLVANADSTKIGGCFVYGFIKGKNSVGGLVGVGTGATSAIDTSFTNTSIDAQTNVGGLVGNHSGGTINNSYSNSEIYSSTTANNYVGGIIGNASSSNLTNVYSACKIIRNGTNTNFGKIIGNNIGINPNCYSRDSVFVNYTNVSPSGFNGSQQTNTQLRSSGFVSTLNGTNSYWIHDYSPDRINDGYPILKYQPAAVKPNSSGLWPTTTASQVVIIKSNVQLKANTANFPKCAYVKIENGGELNNTTNINLFGEYNRELYVGKWNLIGLSTYNRILSCLYNYADTAFKTFVKRFDYGTNNWQASTNPNINTVININTPFDYGEGFLVMPNYSLEQSQIIKSRIVSKGVLFNDTTLSRGNSNNALGFISLANNYPAGLSVSSFVSSNSSNMQNGAQGRLIYVYDADSGKWNNNNQSINPVTSVRTCEGFFIVSSGANGNFGFNKGQMNNTSGAKNVIKSDLIYVKAFANNQERGSFLEFNDDADNAFDFEDGLMLFGNNYNSVEPYFTIPTPEINDSTLYLIKDAFSSLPYTTELDLRSQKSNEVSLDFSNIPSNIHIYLLDSLLNKAQYLNEGPNYELQVNEGDNAKRLYVLFSYYKEDINEFFKPEMPQEIRIWNYNNVMNIEGKDLIRYEIYDVIGNKLLEQEVFNDDFQTQLSLNNGIYIVRAYSKTSSKTEKLSVNN